MKKPLTPAPVSPESRALLGLVLQVSLLLILILHSLS